MCIIDTGVTNTTFVDKNAQSDGVANKKKTRIEVKIGAQRLKWRDDIMLSKYIEIICLNRTFINIHENWLNFKIAEITVCLLSVDSLRQMK